MHKRASLLTFALGLGLLVVGLGLLGSCKRANSTTTTRPRMVFVERSCNSQMCVYVWKDTYTGVFYLTTYQGGIIALEEKQQLPVAQLVGA